MFKILSVHWEE